MRTRSPLTPEGERRLSEVLGDPTRRWTSYRMNPPLDHLRTILTMTPTEFTRYLKSRRNRYRSSNA